MALHILGNEAITETSAAQSEQHVHVPIVLACALAQAAASHPIHPLSPTGEKWRPTGKSAFRDKTIGRHHLIG